MSRPDRPTGDSRHPRHAEAPGRLAITPRIRATVIGTSIDVVEWPQALARIAQWAQRGESRSVCICNVHSVVTASQDAAFANGATGHASLLEDSGPGGVACGSHPSTYVFPSALAAAQECNASGMDLLRAVDRKSVV